MRALKGHVIFLWSALKQQVEKVQVTFSHHTDFFFFVLIPTQLLSVGLKLIPE